MIFGKYQLKGKLQERGYSLTCSVIDETDKIFFAKWIKGIKKDSQVSQMFFDKLRRLKKATHSVLPKIIDYQWEPTQKAYCIIFENKKAKTLEEIGIQIPPNYFLKGMLQLIDCLQYLQQKDGLTHGDITPANILVDENFDFYLIDFGLADTTASLSQTEGLVVFAKQFAAPEKWDRTVPKGFPYQSDIFSLGKVIEWFFEQKNINGFEIIDLLLDLACKKQANQRINYKGFEEQLQKINQEVAFDSENYVLFEASQQESEILEELNDDEDPPKFDVSPNTNGSNILINLVTKNYFIESLWLIDEQKLKALSRKVYFKEERLEDYQRTFERGNKLSLPIHFVNTRQYEYFNLTPYFKKIQKNKQVQSDYRQKKRQISKELGFYKELLEKELEVLRKNSLRLQYINFETKGKHEIIFTIKDNKKYSSFAEINNHIRNATPPNAEEFEYILSSTADTRQRKNEMRFSGIAYNSFDDKKNKCFKLKFKDCEGLHFDSIPQKGYLFENISKKEEEKKRQKEAIRKVEYNDVQSKELIHALFNPNDLQGHFLEANLEKVFQKDENGRDFEYSYQQKKAIVQALEREPLTLIQGPPGTGKTTVITEIVFQILAKQPDAKILITSQTNDAVDHVLKNLLKKEIPIVRLSGVRQPKYELKKHTLEQKIKGWKEEIRKKAIEKWETDKKKIEDVLEKENLFLKGIFALFFNDKKWKVRQPQLKKMLERFKPFSDLQAALEKSEESFMLALNSHTRIDIPIFYYKQQIHKDWLLAISALDENSKINQKLIDSIRVIGATTNHIAAKKYKKYNFEFDYVIMDESGKATVAEALIPLTMANKAVLVGDHRQLRPMLTSTKEVEKWLRSKYKTAADEFDGWDDYFNRPSLFEQIVERIDEDFKSQLEVCRRCSEEQVRLISKCFYEPFGDLPIRFAERSSDKEHGLDLKVKSSIIFLDTGNTCKSEQDGGGSSYNMQSAKLIPQILENLDKHKKVENYTIGIITGYTAQLRHINRLINSVFWRKTPKNITRRHLTVSVIDRFQGLEKDIIIFDLVRSQQHSLGFLANANRINVALSRQKKLLIIIGNYDSILNAKPPKALQKNDEVALHKYLKMIKKDSIVKSVSQIF